DHGHNNFYQGTRILGDSSRALTKILLVHNVSISLSIQRRIVYIYMGILPQQQERNLQYLQFTFKRSKVRSKNESDLLVSKDLNPQEVSSDVDVYLFELHVWLWYFTLVDIFAGSVLNLCELYMSLNTLGVILKMRVRATIA
ncbi:hypothetical protein ACJX0J_005504, partial [Zea mays]